MYITTLSQPPFPSRPRHSRSNATGLLDEAGSDTDVVVDALNTTTESNTPHDPDVASIASSAPSSEDPVHSSLLGIEPPESESRSLDFDYTKVPSAHGSSMRLSIDGPSSADSVRSTERRRALCSQTERSAAPFATQSAFHLAVDKMMMDWERATTGGVGDQLPTIEESATTLDQAIVWPSSDSSTHMDEVEVYGGGQIIGVNGDVIVSAGPLGE